MENDKEVFFLPRYRIIANSTLTRLGHFTKKNEGGGLVVVKSRIFILFQKNSILFNI